MEKKEITISVCGTDGTPHGHGSWELDDQTLEVTAKQYSTIKQYVENGVNDLLDMKVYGLKGVCKGIVDDVLYWAKERGENPYDYRVCIYVDLTEDEEEEDED